MKADALKRRRGVRPDGLVQPGHDSSGAELPDTRPVAMPVGYRQAETLESMLQRIVRNEVSREASSAGFESWQEANDFNVPDDPPDPEAPWELRADDEALDHVQTQEEVYEALKARVIADIESGKIRVKRKPKAVSHSETAPPVQAVPPKAPVSPAPPVAP